MAKKNIPRVPEPAAAAGAPRSRGRRSDGERSRQAILREAAQLATVEGLNGLSIGRLADAVGMSKSGLFAHFGSKEELQIATVETASELFTELVIAPSMREPTAIGRIRALNENFLRHVEADTYPGGCFFASAAAEMDTHPGPVRDLAIAVEADWIARLEQCVREAQDEGAVGRAEDAGQLAFELTGYLLLANALFVVTHEATPMVRARRAVDGRLAAAAPGA